MVGHDTVTNTHKRRDISPHFMLSCSDVVQFDPFMGPW